MSSERPKPKFFIGSTGPAYPYVEALVNACKIIDATEPEGYALEPVPWEKPFHQADRTETAFLDVLCRQAYQCAYGVFFFTPADPITLPASTGEQRFFVRDNVVFETGLFIGARGKNNVSVVVNLGHSEKIKLPSDIEKSSLRHFDLGEPISGKTNDSAFNCLAKAIAERWRAQRFILEPGTTKLLHKRDDCYDAGVKIVGDAIYRVAAVLSYPGEVIDPSSPTTFLWQLNDTKEKLLYSAIRDRAMAHGVKVYRWMNFGAPSILAQAEALVELLQEHNLENELIIKDTYCEFIECIIADDYVLIVLPKTPSRIPADVEVGVGLMIRHGDVARYFLDWFERHLPVPKQEPFRTTEEIRKYGLERVHPPWSPRP